MQPFAPPNQGLEPTRWPAPLTHTVRPPDEMYAS